MWYEHTDGPHVFDARTVPISLAQLIFVGIPHSRPVVLQPARLRPDAVGHGVLVAPHRSHDLLVVDGDSDGDGAAAGASLLADHRGTAFFATFRSSRYCNGLTGRSGHSLTRQ